MFAFSQLDRVLFVAPHPDDESLGGGGLLRRTFAAQIPVRVLFATNGDNNPWRSVFGNGDGESIRKEGFAGANEGSGRRLPL